jgi:hypothetical protein
MIMFRSICGGLTVLLKKYISLFIFLFIIGCSADDSSISGGDTEPFPTQEISGVWLGDFITDEIDNFTIGIITRDHEVRFVGNSVQYEGPEGAVSVTPNSAVFDGDLVELSWDDTWDDYRSTSAALQVLGLIAGGASLSGAFQYDEGTQETGSLIFIYNTTYEESPNVRNLEGDWIASNVFADGNTLTLTIIPDPDEQNTTNGTITGSDAPLGNSFDGEIEIHYITDTEDTENVYDVTLRINGGDDLTGLATIVEEMNTEGLEIPKKTIAMGVSNPESTYMISVLSTFGN